MFAIKPLRRAALLKAASKKSYYNAIDCTVADILPQNSQMVPLCDIQPQSGCGAHALKEYVKNVVLSSENRINDKFVGLDKQVAILEATVSEVKICINWLLVLGTTTACGLIGYMTHGFEAMDKKVETRFEAMDKKVETKFEAMDRKFETRFEAMDRKFDAKFEAMDKKFDAKFEAMDKKVEAMDKKFDAKFDKLNDTLLQLVSALSKK